MPKNDTYDLNEESDLNDQKWPKMTKSNQKWPKTTKKWLKITPDNPKWPKTTQKSKVLRTDGPTNRPTDKAGCRVACTRLKTQKRLLYVSSFFQIWLRKNQLTSAPYKCHSFGEYFSLRHYDAELKSSQQKVVWLVSMIFTVYHNNGKKTHDRTTFKESNLFYSQTENVTNPRTAPLSHFTTCPPCK